MVSAVKRSSTNYAVNIETGFLNGEKEKFILLFCSRKSHMFNLGYDKKARRHFLERLKKSFVLKDKNLTFLFSVFSIRDFRWEKSFYYVQVKLIL